jgi:hypothetical protein
MGDPSTIVAFTAIVLGFGSFLAAVKGLLSSFLHREERVNIVLRNKKGETLEIKDLKNLDQALKEFLAKNAVANGSSREESGDTTKK